MTDVGIGSGQVQQPVQIHETDVTEGVDNYGFTPPGDTQASANGTAATSEYRAQTGRPDIAKPDPHIATLNLGNEADDMAAFVAENNEDLVHLATSDTTDDNIELNFERITANASQLVAGNNEDTNDAPSYGTKLNENLSDLANKHGTTENDLKWALFSPEGGSDPKAAAAAKELTGIIGAPPQEDIDNFIIEKSISYETNFMGALDVSDAAIAKALGFVDKDGNAVVQGNRNQINEAKASLKEMFFKEGSSPPNAEKLQGVLNFLKGKASAATGAPAGHTHIVDSSNYDAIQNGFYHTNLKNELLYAGAKVEELDLARDFLMGKDVKISPELKAIAQKADKIALDKTRAHYNLKTFTPDRTQEASVFLGSSLETKRLMKMLDGVEETISKFTKIAEKMPDGPQKESLMNYLAVISAALVEAKEMMYQISIADALKAKEGLGLKLGMIKDKMKLFEDQQKKMKEIRAENKKKEEEAKKAAEETDVWTIIGVSLAIAVSAVALGAALVASGGALAGPVIIAGMGLIAALGVGAAQIIKVDENGTVGFSGQQSALAACCEAINKDLDKLGLVEAAVLRLFIMVIVTALAVASGNPGLLFASITIMMQSGACSKMANGFHKARTGEDMSDLAKMIIDISFMVVTIIAAGGVAHMKNAADKADDVALAAKTADAGSKAASAGSSAASGGSKVVQGTKAIAQTGKAAATKLNNLMKGSMKRMTDAMKNFKQMDNADKARAVVGMIPEALGIITVSFAIKTNITKMEMHKNLQQLEENLATMKRELGKTESQIEKLEAFIKVLTDIIEKLLAASSSAAEPATEIGSQLDQMWRGASEATTDLVNATSA